MKSAFASLIYLCVSLVYAQSPRTLTFNQDFIQAELDTITNLTYRLQLEEGLYTISVLQQGIDVVVLLKDGDSTLVEKDTPNGAEGLETFEFAPPKTGTYTLSIERLDEDGNPAGGNVSVKVKAYTAAELAEREAIRKELAPENAKVIQTLDIDHFWQAFDSLSTATTRADSIAILQRVYLDRGTDGLKDFIVERDFTAEKFVDEIALQPKFFRSVRANTYRVKEVVPELNAIVDAFRAIYPDFEPKKICFAIGIVNTGGTVSEDFLLIGTEVSTSTAAVDLSEFTNEAFKNVLGDTTEVTQKIKNIVAHEYVHTQQRWEPDGEAIKCGLLHAALIEGMCDFIGELISGDQINKVAKTYGDAHEQALWTAFKNELCNEDTSNWLYNYDTATDHPADLGYYIGYQISEAYYTQADDKQRAIADMLDLRDPIEFLQVSRYDQQKK